MYEVNQMYFSVPVNLMEFGNMHLHSEWIFMFTFRIVVISVNSLISAMLPRPPYILLFVLPRLVLLRHRFLLMAVRYAEW